MYVKAFSILGDRNIAKDVVQEIWISVWERRTKIDNTNIEGYLFRAVRFKIYNQFRTLKYRDKLIEEFVQNYKSQIPVNTTDEHIQFKDTETIIFSTVNGLPKKCKQVFQLSRFEGLKNNEIATS
ncbi:MAG TPA: sigma-70 family RNA polymerase sigma factor [Mariniflexile sp.]|nr:sigma-70 family RNA polymerase sigma factor [Mariniflexile sp.]